MTKVELSKWLESLTDQQLIALRLQRASDLAYSEVIGKTRSEHIQALKLIQGVSDPVQA
jgi:hypothetical protein